MIKVSGKGLELVLEVKDKDEDEDEDRGKGMVPVSGHVDRWTDTQTDTDRHSAFPLENGWG